MYFFFRVCGLILGRVFWVVMREILEVFGFLGELVELEEFGGWGGK